MGKIKELINEHLFKTFLVVSAFVHIGGMYGSQFKWETKKTYMNSDVLLMGENTGKKINPPKPKKKLKKKKKKKIAENDPDALKVKGDVPEEEEPEEGTFGQGGKKPLPYDTALYVWIKANQKFPRMARRLGHEGVVKVEFTLHPDGKMTNAKVVGESDYQTLNKAAIELIYASSPFRPFPKNWDKNPVSRTVPVNYTLTR